jgi:hypothetical protein
LQTLQVPPFEQLAQLLQFVQAVQVPEGEHFALERSQHADTGVDTLGMGEEHPANANTSKGRNFINAGLADLFSHFKPKGFVPFPPTDSTTRVVPS